MLKFTKNQSGFSLVEILVAMVIASILVAGVSSLFIQIRNLNDTTNARIAAISQVENAIHYINRDVQMAQYPDTASNSAFPLSISWKSWALNDDQNLDTFNVTYSLSGGSLIREYRENDNEPTSKSIATNINEDIDNTYWSYSSATRTMTIKVTSTVSYGSKTVSESRVISIIPRPGS
jgi:prepilin-type N-terminal cleavage/methylation domain-containing protein